MTGKLQEYNKQGLSYADNKDLLCNIVKEDNHIVITYRDKNDDSFNIRILIFFIFTVGIIAFFSYDNTSPINIFTYLMLLIVLLYCTLS